MLVRFWGTRGSIPAPGPTTVRYGGNTACVQVVTTGGTQIVLDCGTGVRGLGLHLSSTLESPIQASILLSHTHWDHIQGIPFFAPLYHEGNGFNFYAARGMNKQVGELLAGQMEHSYFPVRLDQLRASISYREVGEEAFQIGDAVVQPRYLNHTTLCLAYRITADGASIVYATDHEPYTHLPLQPGGQILHAGDRELIKFAEGADLLIHDAQYSDDEYRQKIGWGHSTTRYAASIAAAAEAKRLALYHHDPSHTDEFIDGQVEQARELMAGMPRAPEVVAAAEGLAFTLEGEASPSVSPESTLTPAARPAGLPMVLIAENDSLITRMVQDALREDGYTLVVAQDGQQALEMALSVRPNLLILDGEMPKLTGFEVCARLRDEPNLRETPVIMLTSLDHPQHIARGFDSGASDYITKPFTRTVLQSRVRSWLVRRGAL